MKSLRNTIFSFIAFAAFSNPLWAGAAGTNQADTNQPERVPVIAMEGVPLTDGIKNLARYMGGNYIIDPRVAGKRGGNETEPTLTLRYQNVSAEEALQRILIDHKLTLVKNPATTVTRIAPSNVLAKPVPVSQVGTNVGRAIPLLQMDGVALFDAIKQLAREAGLNVLFAPEVSKAIEPSRWISFPPTVSFRWTNISARQALAALLDNYDLWLSEDAANTFARVQLKAKAP